MRRRTFLGSLPVGVSVFSGCLSSATFGNADDRAATETDADSDAPEFDIDGDAPSEFILLRHQPQEPNGVTVGDEFDIGVVLGNAGGEPITGDVSVEFVPPVEDETVQTGSIAVDGDDELPSGAARFFTTGPFEATVAGEWELRAGPEIEQIHQDYDPRVTVEERPED